MATKRLRINFVSHLDPLCYGGGGEQFTRALVAEGRIRGHDVRVVAMKPRSRRLLSRLKSHRDPDLWLLYDIFNCPEQERHFSRRYLESIVASGRYCHGQTAYTDVCCLPFLPCNGIAGDGARCVIKKEDYSGRLGYTSGWKDGYCPVNDNRRLFEGALVNIFLSPLHASVFQRLYPGIAEKTFILRPIVDAEMFFDMGKKRDIKYASYGGMGEAKGFYNIRKRFPDEEVVFFGSSGRLAEKHGYGKVMGRIPYREMPEFLNRVENYIHMPRWPEPHGLIVNQAALCGCRLVTNDNVGALTHGFDLADRSEYDKNSAAELWEMLEKTAMGASR